MKASYRSNYQYSQKGEKNGIVTGPACLSLCVLAHTLKTKHWMCAIFFHKVGSNNGEVLLKDDQDGYYNEGVMFLNNT